MEISGDALAALILGLIFGTLLLAFAAAVIYLYLKGRFGHPTKQGFDSADSAPTRIGDGFTPENGGTRTRALGRGPFRQNDRIFPGPAQTIGVQQNGQESKTVAVLKSMPERGKGKQHRKGQPKMGTAYTTDAVQGLRDAQTVALQGDLYKGLGFNIYGNCKDGIFVKHVHSEGPAHDSKAVGPGDRIMAVTISFEKMVLEDALTILSNASPYQVRLHTIRHASSLLPALKHALGESGKLPSFHPLIRRHSVAERLGRDPALPGIDRPAVQHVAVDLPDAETTLTKESETSKHKATRKVSFGKGGIRPEEGTDRMEIINEVDDMAVPQTVHSMALVDQFSYVVGPHRIDTTESVATKSGTSKPVDPDTGVQFFQDPSKPDNLRTEMRMPGVGESADSSAYWIGVDLAPPTDVYSLRLVEKASQYTPPYFEKPTVPQTYFERPQSTMEEARAALKTFSPWADRRTSEERYWEIAGRDVPSRIYLTKLNAPHYPYDPPAYSQSVRFAAGTKSPAEIPSRPPPVSIMERMKAAREAVFPETWNVHEHETPHKVYTMEHDDIEYVHIESGPAMYAAEYLVSGQGEQERPHEPTQAEQKPHKSSGRGIFAKISHVGWGGSKKSGKKGSSENFDRKESKAKKEHSPFEGMTREELVAEMKAAKQTVSPDTWTPPENAPTEVHSQRHYDPYEHVESESAARMGYTEPSLLGRLAAARKFDAEWYESDARVPTIAHEQVHHAPYGAFAAIAAATDEVRKVVSHTTQPAVREETRAVPGMRIDYDNPPIPEAVFGLSHSAPYSPPDPELRLERGEPLENEDVLTMASQTHSAPSAHKYFKLPEMKMTFGKSATWTPGQETWSDPYGDVPREVYQLNLTEVAQEYSPVIRQESRPEPEVPGFTDSSDSGFETKPPFSGFGVRHNRDRSPRQRETIPSVIVEESEPEFSSFYRVPEPQPIRHNDGYRPYYGAPPRKKEEPPTQEQKPNLVSRLTGRKSREDFDLAYEVPSVIHDIPHNCPLHPVPPQYDGLSRQQIELKQKLASRLSSSRTPGDFVYEVPTVTHDISHNSPQYPVPAHYDGLSRQEADITQKLASHPGRKPPDSFEYEVPSEIHTVEYNSPALPLPKHYDGLSRQQIDSLKYRTSPMHSPTASGEREEKKLKKRFQDVFSIKRHKKSDADRPVERSSEPVASREREQRHSGNSFAAEFAEVRPPVMRDEGTFEPVPYFLEGDEAGKMIIAYPMFHQAPGSEYSGNDDLNSYRFERDRFGQDRLRDAVKHDAGGVVNALTLTAPQIDLPSGYDGLSSRQIAERSRVDNDQKMQLASGIEDVKPRKNKSPKMDASRNRVERPYSTIIVLEGQRIPIYDMYLHESSEPYVKYTSPAFPVHSDRSRGYRSVANRVEDYRRSQSQPKSNEGFVATARPARIDPYQPISYKQRSDPYSELSYTDRLDVLRLSYDDNGVSKSTPDLALQDESPRIERRVIDGRPPMREGTVRAEPLFVGRISPAGPYERTRESSGSSVEMRSYEPPPAQFDPHYRYDYGRGSRSRSRSPQIITTQDTIQVGPEETATRVTSYFTTEEPAGNSRATDRLGRTNQIYKRDSGYGTLGGESIMIDTRTRPGSISPLSPASPVSPGSLNQDQYGRLLHFQQQMMRQNEELNELGISVPYFEPLPPAKHDLRRRRDS